MTLVGSEVLPAVSAFRSAMVTKDTTYSFLTAPKNPNELGMLGPYRVINELGRGGMGFVFRAEDTRLQRSVALKVMNEKIAATKNSRSRFISEARAMAAVDHDNVATIFEVGEKNGTPFMAMEMLQGETLEAFKTRKERPGFEEVIDIATQIARGLAAAHDKGIVHRDIKPANIWIESGTGRVKILDFGLALAQTPVDQLAGRGSVIGTPGYLSPEQARSEPLDNRSDLYSLGVVLYELCTGRLPLQAKTVAGQLIAILAHDPKPLREYNPDIPAPLADMIHRLLGREPKDRPDSARELEQELKRVSDECHAKSEVALALNKLQAGLNEVVNKSQDSSGVDLLSVGDTSPAADPFASIPDPVFDSRPAGSSGSIPIQRTYANPYAKPTAPKPTTKPRFNWQAYWPVIAIAATACVAIPIVVYAVFFMGGSPAPTVAAVPSLTNSGSPILPVQPDLLGTSNGPANNRPGGNKIIGGNSGGNKGAGVTGGAGKGKGKGNTGSNAQIIIRTSEGRGADTTVGPGLTGTQGSLPAIVLKQNPKKPRDISHGYLRFDLAKLDIQKQEIDSATLKLTLSGAVRPAQATLKLYGVTAPLLDDWSESGPNELVWSDTPSKNNLASLPLLAKTMITAESIPNDRNRNVVQFDGSELAEFLRNSESELVNLVISVENADAKQIRFYSGEGKDGVVQPNRVPSLLIKAKKKRP